MVNGSNKMTLDDTLFLIGTAAMFMQGYSYRRKYFFGIIMSAGLATVQLLVGILANGIDLYTHSISQSSISDLSIAIVYTLFWWMLGYVAGSISLERSYYRKR